jgi:serine/threonine protein kinase
MTTTPGILWAEHNLPTPTHRWWSPAKRSKGAFNVRYEEFGEEEARDWVIRHNKGSGGSGVVSAVDLLQHGGDGSPIRVAMKTFTPLNDHARTILRSEMENEIRNVKRLRHIHIVEIIGSFEQSKEMGFFMRPCADDSLAYVLNNTDSMIQRRNKLGSRQKVSFFQFLVSTIGCLAHALKFIHGSELKHKDIKPANILVHGDQVFLTDFGLSKIVRENSTTSYGPTGATKPVRPTTMSSVVRD